LGAGVGTGGTGGTEDTKTDDTKKSENEHAGTEGTESGHADGNSDNPKDQTHAQITNDIESKEQVENTSTYTTTQFQQL
jgi:hypothetical protein